MKQTLDINTGKTYSLTDIVSSISALSLGEDVALIECAPQTDADLQPVRIDAMMIMLVDRGEAHIGIDLMEYELRAGSLMVVQPKNMVSFFHTSYDFHGGVLAISRPMLESIMPKLSELTPLLLHHRTEPVVNLNGPQFECLSELYMLIFSKLATQSNFRKQKVSSLLQCVIFELLDINHGDSDLPRMKRTRGEEIMSRFIIAVSEDFRRERSVSYYADKLNITPKHLSAVVKDISGHTAGQWIENYTIMEAKVLLRTTDLSIQQIAAELNFPNQSFFGKYFKHQAGVSPSRYRQSPA